MRFKEIIITMLLLTCIQAGYSQSQFPDIDPKWDNYYNNSPSDIENHYQASDFINVAKSVHFVPQYKAFKGSFVLFQKVLLSLDEADLKQLQIDGRYFSRTYKHDDYFYLYNLTYQKITKDQWDALCPYLIPLMNLDSTIDLPH